MEGTTDVGTIQQLLDEIYSAVVEHFEHEEELMQNSDYPEYDTHKASHDKLLVRYRDLVKRFVDNPDKGVALLQKTLADWFSLHVSTHDQKLNDFFPG
jgi:hemerythrin-like metal-binding protein